MIHREDPFVATFCLNLIEMKSVTTSVVRLFDRYVFQRNELGALMCERCIFTTKSRKACLIHQKTLHEPEFRSMVSLLLEPDGLPIEPPVVPIEPDAEISEHDAVLDEAMKSIREDDDCQEHGQGFVPLHDDWNNQIDEHDVIMNELKQLLKQAQQGILTMAQYSSRVTDLYARLSSIKNK